MIPPLPPPMPPWPGGNPPWKRGQEAQQPQQPAPQPQQQQQSTPQLNVRPQVIHGLVPPQMLHPTYPFWITPQPRQVQPQQVQPQPQRQQMQQGPMKVERAEEKSTEPQPFHPVLPVAAPGLPHGARQREYWKRS